MAYVGMTVPFEIIDVVAFEKYYRAKVDNGIASPNLTQYIGFGELMENYENGILTLTSAVDGDFHGVLVQPYPPANYNIDSSGKTVTVEVPPAYQSFGDGIFRVELIKRQ